MPEIAEVETVRRTLQRKILRKKVKKVNVLYERMIETDINEFKSYLVDKSFDDILRIGKWLMFSIGDYYLCSHLRMEGKYFVKDSNEEIAKHEHVIFTFEDNTDLRYHDTRKFGIMALIKKTEIDSYEPIKKQGIEPISDKLTKDYLYEKINKSNLPIKTLLLDQTIIAGLGNIYADEVLFKSGILPTRLGKSITFDECNKIIASSKKIIEKAIENGGTTIRSYTSSLGVKGNYQEYLMAHQRVNEPCKICNTLIKKIKVGGRGTYYCEKCQK